MGLQAKACCPFAFFPPDFPSDQRFVYLYCPTTALVIRSVAQMACVACESSCIFVSLCDQYSLGSRENGRPLQLARWRLRAQFGRLKNLGVEETPNN